MSRRVGFLGWVASGLALFVAASLAWSAEEAKPEYVGVNKCKTCHAKIYKAWAATKHASALAALEKGDPKVTADMAAKLKVEIKGSPAATEGCVKCHVTGHKQAGGYPAADSVKTAAVANVTCEACHGPGSKHVAASKDQRKATMATAPTEATCKGCHTAEITPKFDFATLKAKAHPVASGS
jgi:hypothetical protein